ncbi:MAG: efflux transporter outer membrane subunit [Deltaproteobacteria bacterium]|nr:efflux transporter outer membrane subunit [Deltaproteobacteria bacterium]
MHPCLRSLGKTSGFVVVGLLVAALVLLPGCIKVGPDYQQPKTQVPGAWKEADDPALVKRQTELTTWWTVFNDPQLTELIKRADTGNLDLKAAVSRIKEARAQLGVVLGYELPAVDAPASALKQQYSQNDLTGTGLNGTNISLGVEASWEIDLFGRISRQVEAAKADFQASQEDKTDVMVALYAQVAQTYLTVRTLQARIAATQENIESQKGVLKLTQSRFKWGLATDLDVSQAQTVLGSSQSELPPLRSDLSQSLNALALLLGLPPSSLNPELMRNGKLPTPPRKVAVGVPADLLRQRPDIRRAERQLAAATARIGVATADLYPRFSLLGSLGTAARNGGDLFAGGSTFFSIGPSMSWNLFAGGSIRAQIKVQDAQAEQALLTYENTVLSALKEAEDAMVAFQQEKLRQQYLRATVLASRRSLKLAIRLYKEGLQDFQRVLDAQRTLFDFDNALAASRGQAAINLVNIYQALGGGWDPAAKRETPPNNALEAAGL